MSYSQKLRSPLWQKKRLEILERDDWQCQVCRSTTNNLQVHHLFYAKRDPWDYPDEAYQTLCEYCHEARRKIVDVAIDRIRVALRNVPTNQLAETLARAERSLGIKAMSPTMERERRPVSVEDGRKLFQATREALDKKGNGK